MTDLRQAAQEALEALEGLFGLPNQWESGGVAVWRLGGSDAPRQAITALRTSLEQQQAEPVAWTLTETLNKRETTTSGYLWFSNPQNCSWTPLYTTPPQQQAEPVSMRMPKVGDKVICLEDESLGEVVSLTAGGSPDIVFDDGSRGTYMLREFAELFGYVTPPQRPWVGLTDEEATKIWESTDDKDSWELLKRVEAKLKERNSENSNQ